MLNVTAQKAYVGKKCNPDLFRHSRATFLSKHLTEAEMKEYFGWTQASDMAAVYVHLSGRDVDSALLRIAGKNIPDGDKESEMDRKTRRCVLIRRNKLVLKPTSQEQYVYYTRDEGEG